MTICPPPGGNNRRCRAPSSAEMPGAFSRSSSAAFAHRPRRAEMHQQRALAARADAGDLVERAGGHALGALLAVGADREAVGLVAQALEVEEHGRVGRQVISRPPGRWKISRPALRSGPLETADHRHVVDAGILQHLADRRELALAAVDQQQVRPFARGCGPDPPSRAGRSGGRAPRASSRNRRPARSPGRLMLNLR